MIINKMQHSINPKKAVIKIGGSILLDKAEREGLAYNIHELINNNWQVVLLHGGGPQVNALQEKLGLIPNKVGGRRITSPEDLTVVKQAICGEVNVELVSLLIGSEVPAFGCNGASGQLIQATKRPSRVMSGAGNKPIDFGEVGDVIEINTALLTGLLELGQVPVIATLGVDNTGRIFNINADTTAVQIAKALQADLLLLTTQVGGIFKDLDDPKSRIKDVNLEQARQLIIDGVIQGGMIPKVEEALLVLEQGVNSIAIVSAQIKGSFLTIAKGEEQFGTRIHK